MEFGALLRDIREGGNISLRGLAKETGLDSAYLSRVEREMNPAPKVEVIQKITDALCDLQKLDTAECDKLKRSFLEAAEKLVEHGELIKDLQHRFADELRDKGVPEEYIIDAIKQVSLDEMENVLNGDEQLEIAPAESKSPSEIEKRKSKGESVKFLSMDMMSIKRPLYSNNSASDYINKNLNKFKTSSSHSSLSTKGKRHTPKKNTFRAGARAFIEVDGDLTSAQEEQLRSITTLVRSILKEK